MGVFRFYEPRVVCDGCFSAQFHFIVHAKGTKASTRQWPGWSDNKEGGASLSHAAADGQRYPDVDGHADPSPHAGAWETQRSLVSSTPPHPAHHGAQPNFCTPAAAPRASRLRLHACCAARVLRACGWVVKKVGAPVAGGRRQRARARAARAATVPKRLQGCGCSHASPARQGTGLATPGSSRGKCRTTVPPA